MLRTLAVLAAAAVTFVRADIYTTNPVAGTSVVGGQSLTVQWADSGSAPLLSAISTSSIDLYTGSVNQQTWLYNLAASVDVSAASSVTAMIPADLGPSGAYYFVRYTSKALASDKYKGFMHQAYSAKFSLTGMTGTFNSTVMAQIAADPNATPSSGNVVAAASGSASSSTASGTARISSVAASAKSSATSAAASAASSKATSAAYPRSPISANALVAMGVFVGAFGAGLGLVL